MACMVWQVPTTLHLLPYFPPKPSNTNWLDPGYWWLLGHGHCHPKVTHSASPFSSPSPLQVQGSANWTRGKGSPVSDSLFAPSCLCFAGDTSRVCKTPRKWCGSGWPEAISTTQNCNAPTQNSALEGTGLGANQHLVESWLIFGNCPLNRFQGRIRVLTETVVRHPWVPDHIMSVACNLYLRS